jgi:hypothetical protein
VIVPLFKSIKNLDQLFIELSLIKSELHDVNFVFVNDGDEDINQEIIEVGCIKSDLTCLYVDLTRNFGAINASRTGLEFANSDYYTIISADQQDPTNKVIEILKIISEDNLDLVIAVRKKRLDSFFSKLTSGLAWKIISLFSLESIPKKGFDFYVISDKVKSELLKISGNNFSPIAQLLKLGFKYKTVEYIRPKRQHGTSGWTLRKKMNYFVNNIIDSTHLPISFLIINSIVLSTIILLYLISLVISRLWSSVLPEGFTVTILLIIITILYQVIGTILILTYVRRLYDTVTNVPKTVIKNVTFLGKSNS